MDIQQYTDKCLATSLLSEHLQKGTLVLFLGAGISSSMGFPDWVTYVNMLREVVKLPKLRKSASAVDLQIAADEVQDKFPNIIDFHSLLKECLYRNMSVLTSDVLVNKLLVAIGALLMGSKRGSVQRVVTLNFDSLMEWYLSLYGFVVRVVDQLPDLEGGEDVRIYHPHGFLPHPILQGYQNSTDVILGFTSVNERIGTPGDLWLEMLRHIISNGMCLFIGMSENSFNNNPLSILFTNIGKQHENIRPTGIYVLSGKNISLTTKKQFLRHNMVPLVIEKYENIPGFLLGICQKAADDMIKS